MKELRKTPEIDLEYWAERARDVFEKFGHAVVQGVDEMRAFLEKLATPAAPAHEEDDEYEVFGR